ncbi:MAG TPA: PAS domain S-box protein, partial [Cyclobacteriaceae bacterium]|nr:PAS domain S-box protein [Cyclobacteriaceae bacterium]
MKADFIPNNEMGNLIRAKDWSRTPLGLIHTWPQSLITTLSIILHSKFPMFLWWGPELICFYNDAYRPSLGEAGKHPHILGMRAEEAWSEIWTIIKPLIDQVLAGGGATWSEDQLIPIFRNGRLEDVYWTFSYSPVMDESGEIKGVLVTCSETTKTVLTRKSLELAIEATALSTWSLNLQTYEVVHSPRLAVIFGHPESTVLTHAQIRGQLYAEDCTHVVKPAFETALKTGVYQYEARITCPDGSLRWIRTRGTVVFDRNNVPQQMFGTLMDVTDMRLGDEHSARLAAIVESSDDAIISKRLDGTITSWNRGAERVFGYTPDEIIGQSITRLIPPDRLEEEPAIISRLIKGERVDHIETKRVTKHGELIDLSLTISPLRDQSGKIIGASKIARDITRQKKVEKEILENEQRLQMVIEASALGTWELDLRTRAVLYSKRYLEILGFKGDQTPTHNQLLQRLHPDDLALREQAFKEAIKTGRLQY